MTRKEIQTVENQKVNSLYDSLVNELNEKTSEDFYKYPWFRSGKNFGKQLRSCQAYVLETENYYVLKSYDTIVAAIEKSTDTFFDFLRLVYGYTATSAQHISKFNHDYCRGKWNCETVLTWRAV